MNSQKREFTRSEFQLTFRYRFEAAHRFTSSAAPSCMTPHGHTWFAEAVFSSQSTNLGAEDMVVEFSKLKKSWKTFITKTVDHSFLHHHADPILPALKEHIPGMRSLPFPGDPTTELIAALFFEKLRFMHDSVASPNSNWPALFEVIIQETPTNQIRYRGAAELAPFIAQLNQLYPKSWWQNADPAARAL